MAKAIEMKANVVRVARVYGKGEAQVALLIPESMVSEFPMGAVKITIQTLQSSMFGNNKVVRGSKSPADDEE